MKKPVKKKMVLISFDFPKRDLSPALTMLKANAMRDKDVQQKWQIGLRQFVLADGKKLDESQLRELLAERNDVYGFSVYIWNYRQCLQAARFLKEHGAATIIFGGPEAGGLGKHILSQYPFVDAVFVGAAETTFTAFLKTDDWDKVANLLYRRNGEIVQTFRQEASALSDLLMSWQSKDYQAFLDSSPHPVRAAFETLRGCPFTCGYCSWGGSRVLYFDLEKQVKPGLLYLLGHERVEWIYISDSNPLLQPRRALDLLAFIVRNNPLKKPIVFELNPEQLNERLIELVRQLGNDEFAFGLQSSSAQVLAAVRRKWNRDKYRQGVARIRAANPRLKIVISLILGLPRDNFSGFLSSLDFALGLEPDSLYVHELVVLPGSEFFNNPEEYGITFMKEPPHNIVENRSFPRDDYNRAKRIAYDIVMLSKIGLLPEMSALHRHSGINRADLFISFSQFLQQRGCDTLGRKVENASSWFFERYIDDFTADAGRVDELRTHFARFATGLKEEPWLYM